jgi:Druantia protein DruA
MTARRFAPRGARVDARTLRRTVIESLRAQGFVIEGTRSVPPRPLTKDEIRRFHQQAVQHRIDKARPRLERHEGALLQRFATGRSLVPELIQPKLVEVERGSKDELLFRYACLHWSIPVSSGYGRRLRFLVVDEQNRKLIGLIGLGDPVFSLGPRDRWIGWTDEDRRQRLHAVMDAFVLGAVPPYSSLLGGKLVAMLATSDEVRVAFQRKYSGQHTRIADRVLAGHLALITTTSALGRSSIYNRLKVQDELLFESIGFTRGSGDFHFSNGLYEAIAEFARRRELTTSKRAEWGGGFRNKREVLKKSLIQLGISSEWVYHGVRREIFVAPMASNAREYLRGDHKRLRPMDRPVEELFKYFRERWLLPRADRDVRYKQFAPNRLRLWEATE